MWKQRVLLTVVAALLCTAAAADPIAAAQGLLTRVVPDAASKFTLETIPQEDGRDVFEIEASAGKVTLRGSNGVALASALNWYLKEYCHATVSLWGKQVSLPETLPPVPEKVRQVTPFEYRYCFNYCCFSYSMAWWDWAQWERAIDWLAMQGVTLPLSVTGQEAVWQNVYQEMGLSIQDLFKFFVGPGYFPFGWMGCMDGWGGPLPPSWTPKHEALQKKIVARERAFGMTPVLQGFTGHVPVALKEKFPDAKFLELPSWAGFEGTLFVDPNDPLFQRIGKAFIEEQTRLYGTDHFYAADTFIEMTPPSEEPAFLDAMGKAVYAAMAEADPEAVWVMQGWIFTYNPRYWKPPQRKALLNSVAHEKMLLLDLWCESRPAWTLTEAFDGKPWVWCILQNFGNQVSLHGGLPQITENLAAALDSPERGRLSGIGNIMEGLGHNPVVYDLMAELVWRPKVTDLDAWIKRYATRRYGRELPAAQEAWAILLDTAYSQPGQIGSILTVRPTLRPTVRRGGTGCPYPPNKLAEALSLLLNCADELRGIDTYEYDLVHVARQALVNFAPLRHNAVAAAFKEKDAEGLAKASKDFLALIRDVDDVLGTREEFLLGKWLADAKRWASSGIEKSLLEWNARSQITLWGDRDSALHDYASKQWAGMMRGFYLPRWQLLFQHLASALEKKEEFDKKAFSESVKDWEKAWTIDTTSFPAETMGDSVAMVKALHKKYDGMRIPVEAQSLTTDKPATCSHALAENPAAYANDGFVSNTHSHWATDTNVDQDCWWQVDLEAPTSVGRVVVVPFYGNERSYEFFVETSLDGATWEVAADFRGKAQRATERGTTCAFKARSVRYVRVTQTANTANTGRHLVEVMAFVK